MYALLFWLPYSIAAVEICVVSALVFWIVRTILYVIQQKPANGREGIEQICHAIRPGQNYLDVPIALFLFVCFLSVMGSLYEETFYKGFLSKTVEWFVVYYLVVYAFNQRRHIIIALCVLLFTSLFTSIDALWQYYVSGVDFIYGHPVIRQGATAAFKHPNLLGGFLSFSFFLSLSPWSTKNGPKYKILKYIVTIICFWGLLITFSRGAWAGCFVGLGIYALMTINKGLRKRIAIVFAVVLLGSMVLILAISPRFGTSSYYSNFEWRKSIWEDSLVMIEERPFFGHGLNTYMRLFQFYRRTPGYNTIDPPTYAHNCYIQLAAECGLIGLGSFAWILVTLWLEAVKKLRYTRQKALWDERILITCLLSALAAFLVHSMFDTNFYSVQLSLIFWFMMGLLTSTYKLLNEQGIRDIKIL